jgi:hypothetical protein
LFADKAQGDKSHKTLSGDIFESRHDGSSYERLRLESARRFRGGPVRYSTTQCVA